MYEKTKTVRYLTVFTLGKEMIYFIKNRFLNSKKNVNFSFIIFSLQKPKYLIKIDSKKKKFIEYIKIIKIFFNVALGETGEKYKNIKIVTFCVLRRAVKPEKNKTWE
jgi:hypothetical protein